MDTLYNTGNIANIFITSKWSITFKHYESLYCTCNLHNKLLVEWAFPIDDTKAPLFAGKPSANSSRTAWPQEQ